MRLVTAPTPFVADSRSVGKLEIIGMFYDEERSGVDPWSIRTDSETLVWWKNSIGISLRASPRRVFSVADEITYKLCR